MGRNYVAGFVGNRLMKVTSLRAASGEDIGEVTKIITIIRNVWFLSPLFPFKKVIGCESIYSSRALGRRKMTEDPRYPEDFKDRTRA